MIDPHTESISVIIPVLSEGAEPVPLIETMEEVPVVRETIVVAACDDPGPHLPISADWRKVQVLRSEQGRARQMNAGARAAHCPYLLFLHADSRLDSSAPSQVAEALSSGAATAVSFRLAYREPVLSLRLLTLCGRLLSSIHPFALGDQGLGVRRGPFLQRGGFPDVPILEDWILVRKFRKDGGIKILHAECRTSGRRFLRTGVLRQLIRNARILYRYGSGGDPSDLAELYDREPDA